MATDYAQIVEDIDTAVASLIAGKIASYTVGGQSFTYHSLSELRMLRRDYARLARYAGGDSGRRVAEIGGLP